jgi:hypothetical protein
MISAAMTAPRPPAKIPKLRFRQQSQHIFRTLPLDNAADKWQKRCAGIVDNNTTEYRARTDTQGTIAAES